jgi:hypothetical protein
MNIDLEYIEFTRDEIPVSKKVEIDGTIYVLEIQYNEMGDFYTSILYDEDENILVSSKLVYLGNAFDAVKEGMPSKKLVPMNITDLTADFPGDLKVNRENFGEKIKLYLV